MFAFVRHTRGASNFVKKQNHICVTVFIFHSMSKKSSLIFILSITNNICRIFKNSRQISMYNIST